MAPSLAPGIRPIFRWSGEYFGFILNDRFFDHAGKYLGWMSDEGAIWSADGTFVGELVDNNYVLRRIAMINPLPRIPQLPPLPPLPILPSLPRLPRLQRLGYRDALDDL
jgi:hypothetical protein